MWEIYKSGSVRGIENPKGNYTMSTRQNIVSLLFVPCFSLLLCCAANSLDFNFIGEPVKYDREGIMVTPQISDSVIAFVNITYKYSVVLPYSTKWKFNINPEYCFSGNSDFVNCSIKRITDNLTFHDLKTNVEKPTGFISSGIKVFHNDSTIFVETDAGKISEKMSGYRQISYYSIRKFNGFTYILHVSFLFKNENRNDNFNDKLLKISTVGFRVGD